MFPASHPPHPAAPRPTAAPAGCRCRRCHGSSGTATPVRVHPVRPLDAQGGNKKYRSEHRIVGGNFQPPARHPPEVQFVIEKQRPRAVRSDDPLQAGRRKTPASASSREIRAPPETAAPPPCSEAAGGCAAQVAAFSRHHRLKASSSGRSQYPCGAASYRSGGAAPASVATHRERPAGTKLEMREIDHQSPGHHGAAPLEWKKRNQP